MQVSVTVITKNEAAGIRRMLESVRWASEVIVVDSGSTDGTVEIARELADRVVYHPFEDFASQKNFADQQARNDWILNLDADEVCSAALAEEIRNLPESAFSGYWLLRKNYFMNRQIRYCGWSSDWKLRLYRKQNGVWKGKVHESLQLNDSCETGRLKNSIDHYTYKTFDRYIQSVHLFSRLGAEQWSEQGRKAHFWDLVIRPPFSFIKKYFLQLGVLDGVPGFVISVISAYSVFFRYAALYEKDKHLSH